jgi:hypothetical protein
VTALIIGTALALLAVGFVLIPLFREENPAGAAGMPAPTDKASDNRAVAALREIEFDRATGKLSDSDYAALKAQYTQEAIEAMRASETGAVAAEELELAEEVILRYRRPKSSCEVCGPRPESDAVYCSTCGRYLPGQCGGCGSPVTQAGARFCTSCGKTLAA